MKPNAFTWAASAACGSRVKRTKTGISTLNENANVPNEPTRMTRLRTVWFDLT